ncbi:aldo/keto reductase [Micromonospora zamorensis]|uniref:aldo/keto reductase n=1 Tax=Micromonospora zamorensis TaxID=709883 RepID=UPI0037144A7D
MATKVGFGYDPEAGFTEALTPAQLRDQVEENLRRLGRDQLDVVNLRLGRGPGAVPLAERFGALADLRAAGLIRHLGLSTSGPSSWTTWRTSRRWCACRTTTGWTPTASRTRSSGPVVNGASRTCRSSRWPAPAGRRARAPRRAKPSMPSPAPTASPHSRPARRS